MCEGSDHGGPLNGGRPLPPDLPSDLTVDPGPVLGSGRHGTVVPATLRVANAQPLPVAVKIPGGVDRSGCEAFVLRRVDHPHVLRLLAGPSSTGAIVLERLTGGTVADAIVEREGLEVGEVAGLVRAMSSALDAVHACGWIHGDVNPTNIGLHADGHPVLFDLASARRADGGRLADGTPTYCGPLRTATPVLDIRCLAASMLEALATDDVDPVTAAVRGALARTVERADAGVGVSTGELVSAVAAVPTTLLRPSVTGHSGVGTTRPFGPGPPPADPREPSPARPVGRVLGLLVGLGCLFAGAELVLRDGPPPRAASPPATVEDAPATLAAHGVLWDDPFGIVTTTNRGTTRRLRVGRPGDLVAMGMWDCRPPSTLGLYRPATGEWFVFPGWDPGAPSAAPVALAPGHSRLLVERRGGCDRPQPVD